MKQILGDNQFFGINHYDLDKGDKTKVQFSSNDDIKKFIQGSIDIGLDGFMINSNERGFQIVSDLEMDGSVEVHYSVPYPHKFATMVNENGMIYLFRYVWKKSTFGSLLLKVPLFALSRNIKDILPLILDLEIPDNLPKGSYVYLQNIITDLVLGLKRDDLLKEYCRIIRKKGYKPGLITLNPVILEETIENFSSEIQNDLIVCFNINKTGFNVFPSKEKVESFINKNHIFKLMGMSILSSGGINNIQESLAYIKSLPLDYVVYGSSKLKNIQNNYNSMKTA